MKKSILTLFAILVLSCAIAQRKDTANKKQDSLTVSTQFISVELLNEIFESLKDKVTVRQGEDYQYVLNLIIGEAVKKYYRK